MGKSPRVQESGTLWARSWFDGSESSVVVAALSIVRCPLVMPDLDVPLYGETKSCAIRWFSGSAIDGSCCVVGRRFFGNSVDDGARIASKWAGGANSGVVS